MKTAIHAASEIKRAGSALNLSFQEVVFSTDICLTVFFITFYRRYDISIHNGSHITCDPTVLRWDFCELLAGNSRAARNTPPLGRCPGRSAGAAVFSVNNSAINSYWNNIYVLNINKFLTYLYRSDKFLNYQESIPSK